MYQEQSSKLEQMLAAQQAGADHPVTRAALSVAGGAPSWWAAFWLCLLLGSFGAHRFYTGHTGTAIAQLILSFTGISVIWAIIDFISILCGTFKDASGRPLSK